MRRTVAALMMALLLTGCGASGENADDLALEARGAYLQMETCAASLAIQVDYGSRVYDYGMDVTWEREGETTLTLTAPEEVAGVTGHIAAGETALEFDGMYVETGPLDDQGLSPMDAFPALLAALREGYLAQCSLDEVEEAQVLHLTVRDPEGVPGEGREDQLWLSAGDYTLLRGEISSDGATVLTCEVSNFSMA